MDNNLNIKFDDYSEINATREVLEDILNMDFIKNNLSTFDYQRINDLVKWFRLKCAINNDNTFFYKGHEFALVKVHGRATVDKVICFMIGLKHNELLPWYSEKIDTCKEGEMPPDNLLKVIDNYFDKQEDPDEK